MTRSISGARALVRTTWKSITAPAALVGLFAVTSLAGCDVFGSHGTTVRGTVTDAQTGTPIEGIYVSLEVGGGGLTSPLAQDVTDADGEYLLDDPERRFTSIVLEVNLGSIDGSGGIPPANPDYSYWSQNVVKGQESEVNVGLNGPQ